MQVEQTTQDVAKECVTHRSVYGVVVWSISYLKWTPFVKEMFHKAI